MKYTYGDSVRLVGTLEFCEIVGITETASIQHAEALNVQPGIALYTVEFGDGSESLQPEDALELREPTGG